MFENITNWIFNNLNEFISLLALIVAAAAAYFTYKSMKAMQKQVKIMNKEFRQAILDSIKQDESNKKQLDLIQKQIDIQSDQAQDQKKYNVKRNEKIDKELKIIQSQLNFFQEQVDEFRRANIIINFIVIKNGLIALEFKNIGRNIAYVEKVIINKEFLDKLYQDNSFENNFIKDSFDHLLDSKFAIGIDQSWLVSLGSHLDIKPLWSECPLNIIVKYRSGNDENSYKTEITLDLLNYTHAFMINEDTLYNIEKEIGNLANANKQISTEIKSFNTIINSFCSSNKFYNDKFS